MKPSDTSPACRPALFTLRTAALACLAACAVATVPAAHAAGDAASLQARHTEVAPALKQNAFGRPLRLDSTEASGQLHGTIDASMDHAFGTVGTALQSPEAWCEILMLHLNTKSCAVQKGSAGTVLAVHVGRKHDQPLQQAQRVDFVFENVAATADYLQLRLRADSGPLSTRDYRIVLQAVPIAGNKTFVRMDYSYAYGTAARLAMQGYLATVGSDKIGFTPVAGKPDERIGGVRGVVERNTMRYYLAIDAYLDSLSAPAAQQRDLRAAAWFDATEQYPQQLHEVDRADYLAMKRNEFARMQNPAAR